MGQLCLPGCVTDGQWTKHASSCKYLFPPDHQGCARKFLLAVGPLATAVGQGAAGVLDPGAGELRGMELES